MGEAGVQGGVGSNGRSGPVVSLIADENSARFKYKTKITYQMLSQLLLKINVYW